MTSTDWFRELLATLGVRSEALLEELQAQDPETIDVPENFDYWPGVVTEWLRSICNELNPESQAFLLAKDEERAQQAQELHQLLEELEEQFNASLPPNWHAPEIDWPGVDAIELLQLDEGMPLAWVPPPDVLGPLLASTTQRERLDLIETQQHEILDSCAAELAKLSALITENWRAAAAEAIAVMRSGHWRAGQALAAVALDSAVNELVKVSYADVVKQRSRPGSVDSSVPGWDKVNYPRALMVLFGIWGAFKQYHAASDADVPSLFSRHATIHSMSPRQYTTANALIGLMHLIALLCLAEEISVESSS